MGKKARGAKLRSMKRGSAAEVEIVEQRATQVEESSVINKADEELFVLDNTAIVPSKKQVEKKKKKDEKQRKQNSASRKEELQIQKLIDTHSPGKLKAMAKKGSSTANARRAKHIRKSQKKPSRDLWADDDDDNNNNNSAVTTVAKPTSTTIVSLPAAPSGVVPSKHAKIGAIRALPQPIKQLPVITIDVAKSGQSYNPDQQQHSNAIQEALLIETKREKADRDAKRKSVSTGMSAETRALLLGDDDTDSEDESVNDNDDTFEAPKKKPAEKLTRAQRNKQKRIRAEQYEIKERKRQNQIQHEMRGIKSARRKLLKEEQLRKEEKERIEKLKKDSERSKGKDLYKQVAEENPRYAPTYPVALSNELQSTGGTSLRRIKPKGNLVTDRMLSLMDRGMASKKQLKLKKRVEGKRRKVKVRGRSKWNAAGTGGDAILG